MMEAIIDTRIKKAVTFYDVLHKFRVGRGMGTYIMELNLSQELESVFQEPLFLVFLYHRKSYEKLECGSLIPTLEGYRAREKMWVILAEFRARQEVVTKKRLP